MAATPSVSSGRYVVYGKEIDDLVVKHYEQIRRFNEGMKKEFPYQTYDLLTEVGYQQAKTYIGDLLGQRVTWLQKYDDARSDIAESTIFSLLTPR